METICDLWWVVPASPLDGASANGIACEDATTWHPAQVREPSGWCPGQLLKSAWTGSGSRRKVWPIPRRLGMAAWDCYQSTWLSNGFNGGNCCRPSSLRIIDACHPCPRPGSAILSRRHSFVCRSRGWHSISTSTIACDNRRRSDFWQWWAQSLFDAWRFDHHWPNQCFWQRQRPSIPHGSIDGYRLWDQQGLLGRLGYRLVFVFVVVVVVVVFALCVRTCFPHLLAHSWNWGYVRWMHPQQSSQELFRAGRKKQIIDVFGPWAWADEMPLDKLQALPAAKSLGLTVVKLASLQYLCFPLIGCPRITSDQVLEWDFECEGVDKAEIPFAILDSLVDTHGIDLTGLSLSATSRGTRFRTHRLMPWSLTFHTAQWKSAKGWFSLELVFDTELDFCSYDNMWQLMTARYCGFDS